MGIAHCSKADGRIPIVLVTGFLGSGKTSLINNLVKTPAFERSAVVINEYGEMSIDHVLVEVPQHRVRVIDSGCLCGGHVHEEVAASLLELHERCHDGGGENFDFVLIETSGLADPVPIVQILLTDAAVSALYELSCVITVTDGLHGAGHLAEHVESVKQAAVADTIIVNKTDLADRETVEGLTARLRAINPGARQIRTKHGQLGAAQLLEHAGFHLSERSAEAQRWLGDHTYAQTMQLASSEPAISTFSLEYKGAITVPGFVLWMNFLAGLRGAGLLRVKGIVNVEGRPYAVQAVQTVISEPMPLADWPGGDDRHSRLVFITRGMNADDIRRTFATLNFEPGRATDNMAINPASYEKFKQAIELFRNSPARN